MIRLTMASIAWLAVASAATAGLSSYPKCIAPLADTLSADLLGRLMPDAAANASQNQRAKGDAFIITELTEIHLDGRPCRYPEVPKGAAIVLIEVAADGKTVMKVHFRTGK